MGQTQSQTNGNQSLFLQTHSVAIRLWHWLTFLVISFIVLTVLLASTLFSPRQNIPEVQNKLAGKGIVIDNNQAFSVTHIFDDKLWDLHKLLGYGLSFLLLARIGIELTQPTDEKLKSKLKNALNLSKQNGWNKKEAKHYLIVKFSYTLFYLLILYMVLSGLSLAFGRDLGLSRDTNHLIKEIHGFGQYLIYAFIFFHLSGVILADIGKSRGIVSGMINGGK